MDDCFECAICLGEDQGSIEIYNKNALDTFKSPILITKCGHSFCKECLLIACPGPTGWLCPQCRLAHDYPASELTRNFVAEQMMEFIKGQELKQIIKKETQLIKDTVLYN